MSFFHGVNITCSILVFFMDKSTFQNLIKANSAIISAIRDSACKLHESVNQMYDGSLPYGFHLSMVADAALKWGYSVLASDCDFIPVVFGAYFHDSIEDARVTYNDLLRMAANFMDRQQSVTAAEIVYALTNDKGRTRAERAGERYYAGIRATPYAPFVKLCDRYANTFHSHSDAGAEHQRMLGVYSGEWQHFIESIDAHSDDIRFQLPQSLITEIENLMR